jgi:hypothetical protein
MSGKYFTYRFSNLPKGLHPLAHIDGQKITGHSIAPCVHSPKSFNIGTITFDGLPPFHAQLQNGEGVILTPAGAMTVDENFFGITPMNHVEDTRAK